MFLKKWVEARSPRPTKGIVLEFDDAVTHDVGRMAFMDCYEAKGLKRDREIVLSSARAQDGMTSFLEYTAEKLRRRKEVPGREQ